jgi:hypothetical protein
MNARDSKFSFAKKRKDMYIYFRQKQCLVTYFTCIHQSSNCPCNAYTVVSKRIIAIKACNYMYYEEQVFMCCGNSCRGHHLVTAMKFRQGQLTLSYQMQLHKKASRYLYSLYLDSNLIVID